MKLSKLDNWKLKVFEIKQFGIKTVQNGILVDVNIEYLKNCNILIILQLIFIQYN